MLPEGVDSMDAETLDEHIAKLIATQSEVHVCEWPQGCDSIHTEFYAYGGLNVWACGIHGLTIP